MTLEKLLIFGFGLAVAAALSTAGTKISNNRDKPFSNYKDRVEALVEKTK